MSPSSSRLCLLALALVAAVAAVEPKVVSMRFARGISDAEYGLQKRAGDVGVTLDNPKTPHLYYINASVGTPPQLVRLQLDTGSSDMWMFGPNSCNISTSDCLGGDYDVSQSSTGSELSDYGQFEIQYDTPNSGVYGFYFADTVSFGSVSMTSAVMAEATYAAYTETGIMGIGYDTNEAGYASGYESQPYPNIVDTMLNQGLISRRAYSLYLDDLESATGTILFGGYDTDKYSGALTPLPLQPDVHSGNITSFTVVLSAIGVTESSGTTSLNSSFPLAVLLDSGTSFTALPNDLFETLANAFNVQSEYDGELYLIDCSYASQQITIDYQFGGSSGPIIQVPVSEIVIPLYNSSTDQQIVINGQPICQFGLTPTPSEGDILLGDTFLRSAYVVYDLDGQICYIAQAKWGSTSSNIQEIGASGVGNPVSASSASYATETVTPSMATSGTSTLMVTSSVAVGSSITVSSAPVSSFSVSGGGSSSSGGIIISSTVANPSSTAAAASSSAAAETGAGNSAKIHLSRQFGWGEIALFVVSAVAMGFGVFL